MRTRILLAVLSAAAVLLAACSDPPPPPLGNGGDPGQQCVPFAQGRPVTMGIFVLENRGSGTVTIKRIVLPAVRGMTMTRSWLVPIYHDPKNGNSLSVGAGWPYPPPNAPEWPHRKPAIGGTIRPGQDLSLAFGLTRTTARSGTSDGPLITYTAYGNTYTVQENTALVVAARC